MIGWVLNLLNNYCENNFVKFNFCSSFCKRLISKGVIFQKKRLTTLKDFVNDHTKYDVVFNCLGFGSIDFCQDKNLIPIRGQMIRVS
jgi:hypothetical protein